MKFIGKLTWCSTKQEGTSKAGNHWEKVDFVVTENIDRYPSQVLCSAMNDKIGQLIGINIGDLVEIDFDLRVRDWTTQAGEARKSMDASLYRITSLEARQEAAPAIAQAEPTGYAAPPQQASPYTTGTQISFNEPQQDGLPF